MAHEPLRPITASQVLAKTETARRYHSAIWLADGFLERRGLTADAASTALLGVVADPEPGHAWLEGWLSIPYLGYSLAGEEQCWSIRFRCPERHDCSNFGHGKYFGEAGEPTRMFNVRAIQDADDEIHVTEGELDAVTLNMLGLPAVAVPGANNWKPHYSRLLAGFNKVFVWGDPDAKGAEFNSTVLRSVRTSAAVRLSGGDVNETYLSGGYAAIREAMEAVRWA